MKLQLVPISLKEANEFVKNFHRHNKPVVGAKFSIGCSFNDKLVGVCIIGRPIAMQKDDGFTAEVTRCCVINESPKGTCSFLYAAAWRAWKAMGGTKIITYTLQSESGSSLRGAGWKVLHEVKARKEGTGWTSRTGRQWQPVTGQQKFCWIYDVFKKETKKPCRAHGAKSTAAIDDANDGIAIGQAGSESSRPKAGQVYA